MKKKNGLIHLFIMLIVGLIFVTMLGYVLLGDNGIINQEKEKYNSTHTEEIQQKDKGNVTSVKK